MYTGSILRIITKYLNGYLSINSYQFVSSRHGLMILLSIHSCNSSYHFLSSFYSICHGTCKQWFFQNASLNHRFSKSGYVFGWRFQCIFSSVQFSHSAVSNSFRPHESQHAGPPCPSPTPRVHPNSCASSQWCHPAISTSAVPFSSCPQSLPASGSFPMSQLFAWGGLIGSKLITFLQF